MSDLITTVTGLITDVRPEFESIAAAEETQVSFKSELSFALQIFQGSDYLVRIANSNPASLKAAILNIASIGLTLNPALKLAYLVPRKNKVCLDISYMGMTKLATDSGSIKWVKADIVRAADDFALNGMGKEPTHRFNPFAKDRGDILGAYCVAKTIDGEYLTDVMSLDELLDIRDRTEAYKSYEKDNSKLCPWVTDESEMMKKTVIRRAYKMWPKTYKLAEAIKVLNETDGIDFARVRDITPANEEQLKELDSIVSLIPGDTKGRLLKHLSEREKTAIEKLEDLTAEQAIYSINFLKEYLPKGATK